ncbi:Crp/Fnr family transcriptional regulator [Sphingomonas sp.]|uniref:Crp/Fnr family transcriptional regulator n=1 Tax=Sphingomonas sp. TaxID=28214 RepID=UPI00286BF5D4|nr:Crp/Fnr family transcriptional regulator [Sphingomonas sp.]
MAKLSLADRARIVPHLSLVTLTQRMSLVRPGQIIERCYFFESGVASVVSSTADGKQAEIGIIGREGMVDVAAVMGGASSPLEVFIQMPGEAFAIPTGELTIILDESRDFRRLLLGFAHSFLIQVSHTALAKVALNIEDRLARWLLMSCDRSESDTFPVTHEFLSLMLGVRRAGVTDALNNLAGSGLIGTSRGQITILDRRALEKRAGDNYGVPEANYRDLIGD